MCVRVRVDPMVSASWSAHVPPTPLKVNGQSTVFAFVVMVRGVAEVEANVHALVPAVYVAPEARVRSPKMLVATLLTVPANPVKLMLRQLPADIVSE